MKQVTKIILALVLFTFSSCEHFYNYSYEIENKSSSEIIVELTTFKGNVKYIIEKDEKKIIFKTDHGVEKPNGPYFKDVSSDFKKCIVSKNDTLSNKNYLDNSSWSYLDGHYKAIVQDDEFEPLHELTEYERP
jgi:hypothetical protein